MCYITEHLIEFGKVIQIGSSLHRVVFGSTLMVYNLSRLVPVGYPSEAPTRNKGQFVLFLALGSLLCVSGVYLLSAEMLVSLIVLCVFAVAYFVPAIPVGGKRRLRDFGLIKITVLTAVWVGATTILPMQYRHVAVSGYWLEVLMRFVFVFALCVVFDIRDMEKDTRQDIETLPNRIGVERAYRLVYFLLILFVIIALAQHSVHPDAARLIAAVLTAIVTALVTRYIRSRTTHSAFVAMVDGMMLLYAILVLFLSYAI